MVYAATVLEQLLLPPTCIVCGANGRFRGSFALDLCEGCGADLPVNADACVSCAMSLPIEASDETICGACLRKPPRFDAATCAFRYAFPVDHLVRSLKFHARLPY